jgi:hypothetical protein
MNDLLFYDIEVFRHDVMAVFKDIEKKVIRIFHNDFLGLDEFLEGKTLVGFNNYHYDDKILVYMAERKSIYLIKDLNDRIIGGENVKFINKRHFRSLDVNQQIDVSLPSLKKIEGNMGRMILESSVPFSIDRPLTPEEVDQVLFYCGYDVDTTIDIYKLRIESYFQPKASLIEMMIGKDPDKIQKWNTTTISANLLLDKPLPKWASVRIPPDMWLCVPQEVRDIWLDKDSKKSITIEDFGCEIKFAEGGLHGAHKKIKRAKKVKLLDVKSMYPSIIVLLDVLGHATEKYRQILLRRLAVKKTDPILAEALKLILNSVYGQLNAKFSILNNPMAALSVCIYGQIALYELCKRLSPFVEIVNINTDGVAFILHDDNDYRWKEAWKSFERDFSLELEEKDFDLFVQKDVNNYIAVKGDKYICKGGDVNRFEEDAFFKNNNARILDIALVEKLVNNKDVSDTLIDHLDQPHLFQYVLKAGNTYQGTADQDGRLLDTKVNRVFASKKEGLCLYKKRKLDDGLVRFADAPINQYLWNRDTGEIENFEKIIDLNHYYDIITKRLERWI